MLPKTLTFKWRFVCNNHPYYRAYLTKLIYQTIYMVTRISKYELFYSNQYSIFAKKMNTIHTQSNNTT